MTESRPDPRHGDWCVQTITPTGDIRRSTFLHNDECRDSRDLTGHTHDSIKHAHNGTLHEHPVRSSHSDVSADLRALAQTVIDNEVEDGGCRYCRVVNVEYHAGDCITWQARRIALAAPSARAEAAPEREGLDVERLARAIRNAGRQDGDTGRFYVNEDEVDDVAAEYARLSPTSPSSEPERGGLDVERLARAMENLYASPSSEEKA